MFSGLLLLINSVGIDAYNSEYNSVGYRPLFKDIGNLFSSRQSSQAIYLPFSRLPLLDLFFLIMPFPTKTCLFVPSALES